MFKPQDISVAFFDAKPYDIDSFNNINKNFKFTIKYFSEKLNINTVALTKGFTAVCAFVSDDLSGEVIKQLAVNQVKLIAMRCAGYNNVDLQAAFKKIHVVRVPAYSPHAVAEHAVAMMLALNRKIHKAYARTRELNFNINGLLGFDMYGKTAGIIGTGRIGVELIKILKGFGMNTLAFDPKPDQQSAENLGFKYADLPTLYKNSDIISLHCPLTKETHHLINNKSIKEMKPGVMIINTSRGQLIDTKALINNLKNKKISAAGLDVYEEETDYFFEDFSNSVIADDTLARLLTFNNVLVTSHQAFFTTEALHNIAETSLQNIKNYFLNNTLPNEICYKCGVNPCPKDKGDKCF